MGSSMPTFTKQPVTLWCCVMPAPVQGRRITGADLRQAVRVYRQQWRGQVHAAEPSVPGLGAGNRRDQQEVGTRSPHHPALRAVPGGRWLGSRYPGFSALELERDAEIDKDELPGCFPDFRPYLGIAALIAARMWQIRVVPCAPPWSGRDQ